MVIPPVGAVSATRATAPTAAPTAAPAGKAGFADALDSVTKAGDTADRMGADLATGKLQDVHEFMAATTKSQLAVELTVAVRNRAIEAYQEIMRMQV
jgi:flagellar hook-basal body complex protein FliE